MGYEVDFIPVGNGARSGDAILLRWGDLHGDRSLQVVVAIDGGYSETADQIIDHLDRYYGTDRLDLMVSTHPDADHINGLKRLAAELTVDELWMHLPAAHSPTMAGLKAAGWPNVTQMRDRLREALSAAEDLEQVARRHGIPIYEPFQGKSLSRLGGNLVVAGPTLDYYEELLPSFTQYAGPTNSVSSSLGRAIRWLTESWWKETLTDEGETRPENNSSTILSFQYSDRHLLFTGDAGIPALERAVDHLESLPDWYSGRLQFVQVPHHGSRRNVGPTILDRLLGPIREVDAGLAFVSAAPDGAPKHPARKVTNAFRRRGYPVSVTAGRQIYHGLDGPARSWAPLEPLPLFEEVEDDEDTYVGLRSI